MSAINLNANIKFLSELNKLTTLKKIIVSGSCLEYSNIDGACKEDSAVVPNNYFSWAKHSTYALFKIFCEERQIYFDWLRFFYVYGPGQRESSLIPTILKSIKAGKIPKINNIFSANDYIYLDDVLDAIYSAVEIRKRLGIVNIGSGTLTKNLDILKICQIVSASSLPVKVDDCSDDLYGIYADNSKAKALMGWMPRNSLYDGIKKTYEVF
jgi:nucleoside-diphosphate-sugar epimerase